MLLGLTRFLCRASSLTKHCFVGSVKTSDQGRSPPASRVIPFGHVHGFELFVSSDDIQSRQKIQELIRSDLDVTVLISTDSIEIADAQATYVVERSRILVPKFASDLSAAKFSTRARRAGFVNTARVEPGDELVSMHTLRVRT